MSVFACWFMPLFSKDSMGVLIIDPTWLVHGTKYQMGPWPDWLKFIFKFTIANNDCQIVDLLKVWMMSSVIHRNSISLHCRPTCHFLVGGALCNQAYFCLCSECALSLHAVVELGVKNIISTIVQSNLWFKWSVCFRNSVCAHHLILSSSLSPWPMSLTLLIVAKRKLIWWLACPRKSSIWPRIICRLIIWKLRWFLVWFMYQSVCEWYWDPSCNSHSPDQCLIDSGWCLLQWKPHLTFLCLLMWCTHLRFEDHYCLLLVVVCSNFIWYFLLWDYLIMWMHLPGILMMVASRWRRRTAWPIRFLSLALNDVNKLMEAVSFDVTSWTAY